MEKKHIICDLVEAIILVIYLMLDVFWHPSTNGGRVFMMIFEIIVLVWPIVIIVQGVSYWKIYNNIYK